MSVLLQSTDFRNYIFFSITGQAISALLRALIRFFLLLFSLQKKRTCFFKHRFSSVSILISHISQVQTLIKYNYEYKFQNNLFINVYLQGAKIALATHLEEGVQTSVIKHVVEPTTPAKHLMDSVLTV